METKLSRITGDVISVACRQMTATEDKKTILLVDDVPANIQIAREILKDTYKTRVATSGAKALELIKVAPAPDLVLLT